MSGVINQVIGDRAESKVHECLVSADFICMRLSPDPGEDLLVEADGRSAIASGDHGRRAFLQIKGTATAEGGGSSMSCQVDVARIRRWSTMGLPVLLVGVNLARDPPEYYADTIDELVQTISPDRGLESLSQESISLSLTRRFDLPAFIRSAVDAFLSKSILLLNDLSQGEISRNHYEIVERRRGMAAPNSKVIWRHLVVQWKSVWRPLNFWAMLNHIADSIEASADREILPELFTVHVYRSEHDRQINNAVAHVNWLRDAGHDTNALREAIKWPKANSWLRFSFAFEANPSKITDYPVSRIDDEQFLQLADELYIKLDELALEILQLVGSGESSTPVRCAELKSRWGKLDREWETIGRASVQYSVLERFIVLYLNALDSALTFLLPKDGLPEERRARWLRQELTLIQGCYGAFAPLSKILIRA